MKQNINMFLIPFLFIALLTSQTLASISGHISVTQQERLKDVLEKTLTSANKEDLATVYYFAKGYSLLKKPVPDNLKKDACGRLTNVWSSTTTSEKTFYIMSSWTLLGCPGTLFTKEMIDKVSATLNDKATSGDVYYGLESLQAMGQKVPDAQKLVQILQARLKADDSLQNFGYTFHAASLLGSHGQFAFDRIEDIIMQADEIDNRMLQFEGGLAVTSFLLSGMIRLSDTLKKQVPLTPVQVEKFGNYLLNRRTVQSAKGIVSLLEASKVIADIKMSPACISVVGSGQVTPEKPTLTVRICDLLGRPLSLSADSVIAQSATRLADDVVVLSKQKLVATSDPTVYSLDLKHEPGRYRIALTAGPHSASLSATILGAVNIKSLEIGVGDSDQSSAIKMHKIQYPNKLEVPLEADAQQRVVIKFSLGGRVVHQAFVRLECQESKREVIFVAEVDSSGVYKFDMDVGTKSNELGIMSGKYNIELIIGDAVISNPLRWLLASTDLKVSKTVAAASTTPHRGMRPEIKHMFREPEKRPSEIISTTFTVLAAAPFLVLLIMWIKLGVNVKNFRFTLSALLFHGGLAAIYVLFGIFWLKLDMFTTCRWLLLFSLITFVAGHRLLSSIAGQKKH